MEVLSLDYQTLNLNSYQVSVKCLCSITLCSYHQQQNKWYLQMILLAHFEATLDFSPTEFNNKIIT